tara:strand:- start:228 stop:641 length:414 start_codon:yes stop_codon:yes gene_type:complete
MEDYNKLLDRFDNALMEKELLNDEIKELKKSLKKGYERCNDYSELVNDQADEIKELKKDVEFYRSKVKVLLNDMLQFGRNDIKKVDINNMVAEIMRATLSYEQEINMNDKDKKELTTSLKCIINNNINLGDKGGKNA